MQHIFQASPVGRQYADSAQAKMSQKEGTIEMSLREHLLAAAQADTHQQIPQPVDSQPPLSQLSVNVQSVRPGHSGSLMSAPMADDHLVLGNQLESSLSVGQYGISSNGTSQSAIRKASRPLAATKRAAQNRSAQRAFRHRKEEYIKSLKVRVDELEREAETVNRYRRDISELKDYTLLLQSKLLALHGECPPPPASLDLTHGSSSQYQPQPQHHHHHHHQESNEPSVQAHLDNLQAAAAEASQFGAISSGDREEGSPQNIGDGEDGADGSSEDGQDYQSLNLMAALSSAQSTSLPTVSSRSDEIR